MFFDFVVLSRTMKRISRRTTLALFLGDILFFVVALWLTLFIRYAELPSQAFFLQHLGPFAIIFAVWLTVFFVFDLYRRPTTLFRRQLPGVILRAQIVNTLIAVIFFYYLPVFGITPRTNLFIYLIVSFILIVIWRTLARRLDRRSRRINVVFLCQGAEVDELEEEFSHNSRYGVKIIAPDKLAEARTGDNNLLVVFNPYDRETKDDWAGLYRLIFAGVTFINIHNLYEEIFEKIPISILDEQWFLENISSRGTITYDLFKRVTDVLAGSVLGLVSLVFYPFIILAVWLSDGRPFFFTQERVGKRGRVFKIIKFRSMRADQVTSVGRLLRVTRLDELPQLWNVVRGNLSLIGPRPERPDYAEIYRNEVPYYNIRHLIKPGLSGWAQLYHDNHPHFHVAQAATTEKLSYDLYYVKHRGIILDVIIGLKTIRALLLRTGA